MGHKKKPASEYEALKPYATPNELRCLEALIEHRSFRMAAESIGKNEGSFNSAIRTVRHRAALARVRVNELVEHAPPSPVPPPPPKSSPTSSSAQPAPSDEVFDLFTRLRAKPIPFEELCDQLDRAPKKVRDLISQAADRGLDITLEHDQVGVKEPEPTTRRQDTGIAAVVGETQRVAIISDTHLGSKYCLRAQLRDFIMFAYHERGVREILHPGDVVDGHYAGKTGQLFETSHLGLDAQCQDLYEVLPELPGLTYHAITGNHDETFWAQIGYDAGHAIERYFRSPPDGQKPRNDLKFYGNRGAHLDIRGIRIHLWHPRSGKSYAKSYHMQKLAALYSGNEKPHIALAGHWHIFNYCVERGIHLIACPTFQGGGSAFGRSIGGAPEIGGLVLSWDITEHSTIRNFVLERRSYFEVEGAHHIDVMPGVYQGFA